MKRVIIAGMGPGSKSCITEEVKAAIDNAEIIIGSKRLIEEYPAPSFGRPHHNCSCSFSYYI